MALACGPFEHQVYSRNEDGQKRTEWGGQIGKDRERRIPVGNQIVREMESLLK